MTVARTARRSRQRGSALLAALCFASVLSLALGSYITLCYRTLEMSSRTMQSARSVELAETGMEEALWALNNNDWSGWSFSGATASKTLTGFAYDNGITGSVNLTVTNYDGSGGTRIVTVTGTTHTPNGADLSRTLTSTADRAPLFVNALAGTTSTVVFSSGGTVDSYDSSLGTYDSQTPTYSAIVASTAPATTSATVQLVNAQVMGYAASLYSGGPSYSTSATLVGPETPVSTKIDPARISTSPYQPIFTISPPAGVGSTLSNPPLDSISTIGTPGDSTPAIYRSTGLDLRGTTKIVVDGPVQLVVSGNFFIGLHGGSPSIEVTANGSLEVFAASDIAIYGGGINNLTEDPSRLAIFGTNTLTVPDMDTTMPYYGVVYTPDGNFTVAGNTTIYGAIVARKISLTGAAPAVHYDLNLRQKVFNGIETPYAVSGWHETTHGG